MFIVVAIALLMHTVGMSMALGTFLAGVLLANSEYRHALETDLEPFKGLLLGLFFIAIGMSVDVALIRANAGIVLLLVTGFVGVKILVLCGLAKAFALPKPQHAFFAISLSQGGEFAFVLNSTAQTQGILPAETAGLLVAAVALSMMTTPLLLIVHDRWLAPRLAHTKPEYDHPENESNLVIIAGFGRFGQIVGRLLSANGIEATVLDHDPVHIETIRKFGHKVFYGDATRIDLLRAAGAEQARLLVVAIDDVEHSLRLIDSVKTVFPHLEILARARNVQHAFELIERGVSLFERETFDSALRLGEHVLVKLGFGPYAAHRAALRFRAHDIKSLRQRYLARSDEETLLSVVKESRLQLEQAMTADRQHFDQDAARESWK